MYLFTYMYTHTQVYEEGSIEMGVLQLHQIAHANWFRAFSNAGGIKYRRNR
jgi:hypothetical protein